MFTDTLKIKDRENAVLSEIKNLISEIGNPSDLYKFHTLFNEVELVECLYFRQPAEWVDFSNSEVFQEGNDYSVFLEGDNIFIKVNDLVWAFKFRRLPND